MARGFLSGAFLGAVVSIGGAVGLSLLAGGPVMRSSAPPDAAAVDVPAGSEFNQSRKDEAASLPGSEPVQAPGDAPMAPPPAPDNLAGAQIADTDPGTRPETGGAQGEMNAPETSAGDVPEMAAAEADAPVQTGAGTEVPAAPQAEAELSISTEPAQPQAPPADTESSGFAPQETEPQETETHPAPAPEAEAMAAPAPEVQSDAPAGLAAPEPGDETGPATALPEPEENVQAAEIEEKPSDPEGQQDMPATAAEPAPATQPMAEAEAEPAPVTVPQAAPEPEGEDVATIRIGKPASNLKTLGTGVQTGRLPSVASEAQSAPETEAAVVEEETIDRSALPPVERFAADFQATDNKPKMAIVLIDEGKGPVGIEALSSFPYPLSFAVDASRDDAEEAMAKYRAAGFEVLAMVRLPEGATPADVETAMPVLLSHVPEAVGVMEAPGDGIQFDRKVSDQVAQILATSGHGLLLYSKGLNTAQKLAAKNGVPSSVIFRDIDDKDQNASAIRRFLNYGVLNAGNEGGVVMVGRLRPDTVTALLLWGLEDRVRQITLAPVSRLLQVQQ